VKSLRFLLIALLVIVLDQASKIAAIAFLEPGVSKPFVGEVLKLNLVRNDSAAFSIGNGQTWIFTMISALAALALLWFGPRMKTKSWQLIAAVLLGGVLGNLIDRVIREPGFPSGHVVDFLQLPFGFPIFNVADMAICFTMITVVIRIMRGHKIGQ
jgi:signal peptidase II